MAKRVTIKTSTAARGSRIDLYLAQGCPELDLTRSRIQELIREGQVRIADAMVKPHHRLSGDETITVVIPDMKALSVGPADIPLQILYEDRDLIVIDKPAGLVVHPAPGNLEGTLVNALLHHCRDLSGIGGVERPGIVHRLDKDTSGVMVAAKNDAAHQSLSRQIKARQVKKIYLAIVRGILQKDSDTIEMPIGRHRLQRKKMIVKTAGGRNATTHFQVEERFEGYTLLSLTLKTGRTHQIRVHLASIHHPVVGDPLYGGKHYRRLEHRGETMPAPRQMLHSRRLGFRHPGTGDYVEFEAPVPEDMAAALRFIGSASEDGG
ncbi:MAG: RluA family pseudouridine synthase [bacterium]|nr:RluA family pseudouridine synthase [bacterium]